MHRTIVRLPLWLVCTGLLCSALALRADESSAADPEDAPRAAYALDALAAQLTTPQAAFEFVRDRIAPEPYAGVMKGAAGTLLTRGGNDWDRALLLQSLLAEQGIKAKLVGGPVSAAAAQASLASATRQPDAVTRLLASLPKPHGPSSPRVKLIGERLAQAARERAAAIASMETAPRELLTPVVAALAPPSWTAPVERVWVRAVVDGAATDFDPAPGAAAGAVPATTGKVWEIAAPAKSAWHAVTFKLLVEKLAPGGKLQRTQLLTHEFRAADLIASGFRFLIIPRTDPDHAGDFRALLITGENSVDSRVFRLSGQPAAPAESGGMGGGLFGGLGGESDEAPKKSAAKVDTTGPVLARLWVEVSLRSPGLPEETFRRTLLDRIEADGAGWRLVPALAADAAVRSLLLQSWDGALDVGAPHPAAVYAARTAALQAIAPIVLAAQTHTKIEPGDLSDPGVSPQLLGYFLASGLRRHALAAGVAPDARLWAVRPRVALLRRGFELADWTKPGATPPRYREGIDLLNSPFRFAGPPARGAELAVRAGIADTALEIYALRQPADWNTLPIQAEARKRKLELCTLRAAADLAQVQAPAPIRAVLAAELAAGRTLVLPSQPVAWRGGHVMAWWSVDPASGYALGKVELGGGQGLVEVSKMHERISDWTEIFGKFYGNVMKCYLGAMGDALGAVEPDWENLEVKVTINHGDAGETPLPSGSKLMQCVIDAACEALSDIVTSAISESLAGEAEAATIRDMIAGWLSEKAVEKTGEMTNEACNKILSGAAGTGGGE